MILIIKQRVVFFAVTEYLCHLHAFSITPQAYTQSLRISQISATYLIFLKRNAPNLTEPHFCFRLVSLARKDPLALLDLRHAALSALFRTIILAITRIWLSVPWTRLSRRPGFRLPGFRPLFFASLPSPVL